MMNRFNYLADERPRPFALFASTLAIDNRIRGPLAALFATLMLTIGVSGLQLSRLHAAQSAYTATAASVAASEIAVASVHRVRTGIDAKIRLVQHIEDVRRTTLQRANELAWIGNHLPTETWLHALRFEDGAYSLDGTAGRVAAVGNAMLALREESGTTARLLSLRDDPTGGSAHIHYTLRLEVAP